jgi:hypothetical protein
VIENSLEAAKQLIADVDLELLVHNQYGKGFMKVCRVSPDAYIQYALQLAYYRVRLLNIYIAGVLLGKASKDLYSLPTTG